MRAEPDEPFPEGVGAARGVRRARLRSQRIGGPSASHPAEVVRWMGAVQAQDYLAALWAVGVRAGQADERTVEGAIAARRFVRTWPMRGTLHFVPAEDVRWMLELLAPRVLRGAAGRHRQLELDGATLAAAERVVVGELEGGRTVTRSALYQALEDGGVAAGGSRGLHILSWMAQRAVVCFGPREGKQPTFVLLDEWLPVGPRLTGEDALAELARRYFLSHGPATVHDLAWWSGLTLGEARAAASMAHGVEREDVGGRTLWFGARSQDGEAHGEAGRPNPTHLLPAFDEFTVAYRDRSDVLDARHARQVANGGMLSPTLVIDGEVRGTWRRTLRRKCVEVSLRPFRRLSRSERESAAAAADRYGAFLGLEAVVTDARPAAP